MASEKSPERTVGVVASVTVEEAADLLFEAPDTIATLIRTGELPVLPSAGRAPHPRPRCWRTRSVATPPARRP
jgi:hypothetical protein